MVNFDLPTQSVPMNVTSKLDHRKLVSVLCNKIFI